MFFSFIVPVFNTSLYLDQCLKSILCQTGAKFEILLIDDGSTDDSGEKCDEYAKQYPGIVRVIHKNNEGSLLARRTGFYQAHGDWLICVDSDDYIAKNYLTRIVEVIDNKHCDTVMYNYCYFNEEGIISDSNLSISDQKEFTEENMVELYEMRLLSNKINMLWLRAFKRELIDFDVDYSKFRIRLLSDDAIQVLPLMTNSVKTVFINEKMYFYRKGRPGSITSETTYNNWQSLMECFLLTEPYLEAWNIGKELRRKFYTYYSETLTSFIRWSFNHNEDDLPKPFEEIIVDIHNHPAFVRCFNMYCKKYSKTVYLRYSVPKIMKRIRTLNINGLKRYFEFEKKYLIKR